MILRPFLLALCLSASICPVWMSTTSKPCVSQQTDYGYVCVCNSTYCDTITAPTKLKSGKYYHYTTSETSPGFNLKKGTFDKSDEYGDTSEVYVTVDASTQYQTLSGVGVGVSDSAAYVYSELSTKAQENLMKSYFGTTGIEITFLRVPVGDTDFSLEYYSYDDTVGDVNMTDFALTSFETETRMPVILSAISTTNRTLKLLATPWTSPSWMKDNNDTEPGFLIPSYQEAFTNYIIKFLDAHKEQGIEYWGLSPMNEVIFGAVVDFSMPNIMMLPPQCRAWIRDYVGPMMEEAGYGDVKILALDDERVFLTWYGEALLSDNETAQYIDGFAVHWYADSDSNTYMADDFHTNYPNVFLLLTEASGTDAVSAVSKSRNSKAGAPGPNPTGGFGPNPTGGFGPTGGSGGGGSTMEIGSWATAVEYIAGLIQDYQHWSIGFIAWNMCLLPDGGPYMQMSQESPIIVNATLDEFYKQPFYYGLGHFSKFMYPDSVLIDLTVESSGSTTVAMGDLQKKTTKSKTTTAEATTANPQPSGGPGPNPTGGSVTGGGGGPTGGGHSGNPGPNPTRGSVTGGGGGPTGGGHSGNPGPNPTGGGGGPTGGGHSGGVNPTGSTTTTFEGIASTNPDGSTTVILLNPSSDEVTVSITDPEAGTITTKLEANSLNTFIYW